MKQLTEFPFVPNYDPVMPFDVEETERGVLCILFCPGSYVKSVRMDANIDDIMDQLCVITGFAGHLKFYELGDKMIIMHNERNIKWKGAMIYDGKKYDIDNAALICNKDFTSLTKMEAMNILSSSKMHVLKNGTFMITIEVK